MLSGELPVGEVLPAERELAVRLGVSRSAVREAVRALNAMGVLTSRVGAGSAGGTVVTALPTGVLTRFLRMHVALAQFPLDDVIEVRCSLETLSARLSARNATPAQLAELDALVDAMADPGLGREEFNDLDTDFHVAIARAAGNSLATDLTVAIRESVRHPIRIGLEIVADVGALRQQLRREHREIARALRVGDGERAARLLDEHIRGAATTLFVQ